jgi:Tfp pilus assembly protein PilN
MRININLASQKYEDAREFYLRWGSAVALVLLLSIGIALVTWYTYRSSASDRKRINELREKISRLDEERRTAEAILNRPENQDVRDQTRFWNDVIDKKSFSWTQLLSDLEKVMPGRAYVESVQPNITQDRRLQLRLMVAGEKHEALEELMSKMSRGERFRDNQLVTESVRAPAAGAPPVWEFEIVTYYVPGAISQPRTASSESDTKQETARATK